MTFAPCFCFVRSLRRRRRCRVRRPNLRTAAAMNKCLGDVFAKTGLDFSRLRRLRYISSQHHNNQHHRKMYHPAKGVILTVCGTVLLALTFKIMATFQSLIDHEKLLTGAPNWLKAIEMYRERGCSTGTTSIWQAATSGYRAMPCVACGSRRELVSSADIGGVETIKQQPEPLLAGINWAS